MILLSPLKTTLTSRYYHSATHLLDLLQLSVTHNSRKLTRQCHARIVLFGFTQNSFLATKLISAYAVFGIPNGSQLVFDTIEEKTVFSWNSLINGYVKNQAYDEAFHQFFKMGCSGVVPDDYTLATLSKVCCEIGDLNVGRFIHGKCVKIGSDLDVTVANSLMSMYSKCGDLGECLKVFDEMPDRNVRSWNIVIAGFGDVGGRYFDEEIVRFMTSMQMEGFKPDAFTVSSLLLLCDYDTERLDYGRELHGFIVRFELGWGFVSGSDIHLGCCLIDMYSRTKKVDYGRRVFERMKKRNVYAWTAMINSYMQNADPEEAMALFREMQLKDRVEPNRVSIVSALPGCSSLASLTSGKQIHGYAIKKQLANDVSLCNALIDIYSKCGNLNYARRIFEDGSIRRDAISWSSMISGYGLHGKGKESVFIYDTMLQLGNKPDAITVVGILSACGRSGLVDEGLRIYNSAIREYGVKPTIEICACIVDMLGKSGQLQEALNFIRTMPMKPGPSIWGALVSASIMHGNCEMQDLAYGFLVKVEPENPSNYISLSNVHASAKRWDVVADVRTVMKEMGLRKVPGCSWITISDTTHCFYATDKAHPCSNSIYEMLNGLIKLMKEVDHSLDSQMMV
ncbi:Pentatricopeptide repeat (PPR) superfamily protein [Euphorbia peplus]|nr:Pentatricopeptide repeat (PPR) superfamily protein [Euphorbia peplus]